MKQICLILPFILFSCMSQPTHYLFADGSGNRYFMESTTLEYIPITPEESSTGMYSGGIPGKVTINEEQFNSVKNLLDQAIAAKPIHLPDRIKTSGQIVRTTSSDTTLVVIDGRSQEMRQIESLLHTLLPPNR